MKFTDILGIFLLGQALGCAVSIKAPLSLAGAAFIALVGTAVILLPRRE